MKKMTIIRSLLCALFAVAGLLACAPSFGQVAVGVAVNIEPPELPVYDQPVCPGDNYIWTPGYWAWDGSDYYWVPGTWVLAPEPGFFWTPGYWAWQDTGYVFTAGFWGPVVGFYGGIDYGFGYFGHGYVGGRWNDGHFYYNTAVNNVNVTVIHNTYVDRTVVVNNTTVTRVSYNGGRGGITARPTREEETAARERRVGPVEAQMKHEEAARSNRDLHASVNHGRPPVAATPRPGEFKGNGVVAAKEGGAVHTEEARPGGNGRPEETSRRANAEERPAEGHPNTAVHPNELPPAEHMTAPNSGNPKLDEKYQKQQEKLAAQQAKERQNLQQKQDQEHAKAAKQNSNEAQKQQMEQRHQQQTQQLQQKHQQQQQQLQKRQAPPPHPTEPPHPKQ